MILLVIDIQKGITDERLYSFRSFVRNVEMLIDTARRSGTEVIHVQHDDGEGSGFSVGDEAFEIYERFAPAENEKVFVKDINSCFGNEELKNYLESQEDRTLIIIGLQTDFCIDATIKSAFERGFRVIVPQMANSTFANDYMDAETTYRYYNDMMWPKRFAECIPADQAAALMADNR